MKHEYLVVCFACMSISMASAQTPLGLLGDDASPAARTHGPATAAVGDPYSFGRTMRWRGGFLEDSGVVLANDCSGAPDAQRCVQLQPAPATTNFEEKDLSTIVLPANSASAHSLLCQVVSPYIDYTIFNPDPQLASQAQVFAAATLRVESSILEDPELINPVTGQPFGGFFEETLPGEHRVNKTLGARQSERSGTQTVRASASAAMFPRRG